jgi:hypothetical protein
MFLVFTSLFSMQRRIAASSHVVQLQTPMGVVVLVEVLVRLILIINCDISTEPENLGNASRADKLAFTLPRSCKSFSKLQC